MALRNQTRTALIELTKALHTPSAQTDSVRGSLVMIGPKVGPDSEPDEADAGDLSYRPNGRSILACTATPRGR